MNYQSCFTGVQKLQQKHVVCVFALVLNLKYKGWILNIHFFVTALVPLKAAASLHLSQSFLLFPYKPSLEPGHCSRPKFRMTRSLASKIAFSLFLFSLIAPLLTLPRPRPTSRPQVSPIATSATKRNPSYVVFKLTVEHKEVPVQYPFWFVRTVTCDWHGSYFGVLTDLYLCMLSSINTSTKTGVIMLKIWCL